MYKFADPLRQCMDQDSAVLRALERTDRGLFDVDDTRDEDRRGALRAGRALQARTSESAIDHMTRAIAVSSTAQARGRSKTGASSRAP